MSIVPENRRSPIHLFAIIIIPCVSRKSRNLFTRDAQPSMLVSWYAFLFYMLSLPLPPIIPVIILFSLSLPLSLANIHIHTHTHSLINSNSKCYNKIRIRIRIVRNLNSISVRTIIQIEEPRVLMHAHKLLLLLLFKFHSLIAILLRAQFEDRALRQGWNREGVSWLVPWRYSGCASCDLQIHESYPSGMNLFSFSFSFSFCYLSFFSRPLLFKESFVREVDLRERTRKGCLRVQVLFLPFLFLISGLLFRSQGNRIPCVGG